MRAKSEVDLMSQSEREIRVVSARSSLAKRSRPSAAATSLSLNTSINKTPPANAAIASNSLTRCVALVASVDI